MNQSLANLGGLPYEMIFQILLKSNDLQTIARYCQTSQRAALVCQDENFWKLMYYQNYGRRPLPRGMTWKERFQQPVQISLPISVGVNHDGIIDNRGRLYMSGENDLGQLGTGRIGVSEENPVIVPFGSKVISISCGMGITGAVTEDGKVYVWGSNRERILIEESTEDIIGSPHLLKLPRRAVKISCGNYSFAVILDDLSVYFKAGQVMTAHMLTEIDMDKEWFSAFSIPNTSGIYKLNAVDIVVGESTFAAIDTNGKLYLWGRKMWERRDMKEYVLKSVHVPLPEPIKQVSLGRTNIIALTETGKVYSWQRGHIVKSYDTSPVDELGQTRLTTVHLAEIDKLEVKLPANIVQISTGLYRSSAVSENGKLYLWRQSFIRKVRNKILEIDIGFPVVFNLIYLDDLLMVAMTTDGYINMAVLSKRFI